MENVRLTIRQSCDDNENPRDWDNLGTMACSHSRYDLGDNPKANAADIGQELLDDVSDDDIRQMVFEFVTKDKYNRRDYKTHSYTYYFDSMAEYRREFVQENAAIFAEDIINASTAVVLPLYLYDHGGITMSTSAFSCPWDSGQVGFIYATKETILKEFGNTKPETIERVKQILIGEVKTYDQYLRGDVYGYTFEKANRCDSCGSVDWEVVDSCCGFYGTDWQENGLADALPAEALPLLDDTEITY